MLRGAPRLSQHSAAGSRAPLPACSRAAWSSACSASGQARMCACSMPAPNRASALRGSSSSAAASQRSAPGSMPVAASARACARCRPCSRVGPERRPSPAAALGCAQAPPTREGDTSSAHFKPALQIRTAQGFGTGRPAPRAHPLEQPVEVARSHARLQSGVQPAHERQFLSGLPARCSKRRLWLGILWRRRRSVSQVRSRCGRAGRRRRGRRGRPHNAALQRRRAPQRGLLRGRARPASGGAPAELVGAQAHQPG